MDITKRRLMQIGVFVGVLLAAAGSTSLRAAKPPHVYVLWEGLEPDKCGVAWLVKRFVDKGAVFRIVKKGTVVAEGIPLDTPDSRIQRSQDQSAFEIALGEYKLESDPALKRMGRIIWDIEINKWQRKVTPESAGVSLIIYGLVNKAPNELIALDQSMLVYDALYSGLEGTK